MLALLIFWEDFRFLTTVRQLNEPLVLQLRLHAQARSRDHRGIEVPEQGPWKSVQAPYGYL